MAMMSPEEAINLGYSKSIDLRRTLAYHHQNQALINHAVSELRPDQRVLSKLIIIFSNFLFLIRMIAFQLTLVSLPHSPILQLFILSSIEVVYFVVILCNYCRFKYLKMVFLFVTKLVLSLFLLIFFGLCFKLVLAGGDEGERSVPEYLQFFGIYLILGAVGVEYVFLFLGMVIKVYLLLKGGGKSSSLGGGDGKGNPKRLANAKSRKDGSQKRDKVGGDDQSSQRTNR